MREKPSQPKKPAVKTDEHKSDSGIEGAPELRFSLPSIPKPKPTVKKNRTAIYFVLLFFICLAAVPLIFYIVTGKNPIDALKERVAPPPIIKPLPSPKVTIEVQKSKNGAVLIVRWDNLPAGTARIKIYRTKAGTTNWVLWKTEEITIGGPGGTGQGGSPGGITGNSNSGSVAISLGKSQGDYVYYVQAVGFTTNNNSGGAGGSTSTEIILWQSSSTAPVNTAPPPPAPSPAPAPAPAPSPAPAPAPAPTPTPPPPPPTPAPPPPPPPAPSGIPYYTPQGTLSGYGQPPSGNFWVQHTDNKIDIGWQNLSSSTTSFIISRSQTQSGPWTAVFSQQHPLLGGPYTLKIVDETLYTAYYYKMDVSAGSQVIATYGPTLLPALGQ